ncbi:TlyA family RNA methyltransferase [Granulicoccus phenolivorans]|uniref:TlyA family RNA methyltransferase n=1 Tax=Granulicoccus phenolivorans TaxID=266854 RepID=UPI00041649B2|nr:TlyA family RNA methyltransferase [Granulicoccus phenolivorans]
MRLDRALTERGLARSRSHAAQLIRAGRVTVAGTPGRRPAQEVGSDTPLTVADDGYVSRAAYKLLGALAATGVAVPPRVLDAGASTGGFTQVCLERGAQTVYAVDVGHDQLAAELRTDPRVRVRERLNLRELTLADVDDTPVDLVVADVSFISLTLLLAPMLGVLQPAGDALLMVKPQFEVGRERLTRTGVVRDPALHDAAVDGVLTAAADLGWHCHTRQRSVLPGQDGNVEFFVWLRRDSPMLAR